jgi:hypothetical protein
MKDIPEDAWWATDYHISWLAGALALFIEGDETKRWPNKPEKKGGPQLVEGNQEDMDLVIATGCDLILIEAKAYGAWNNAQLASKLERLELLHKFYKSLVETDSSRRHINFHFLLISPPHQTELAVTWPAWACRGEGPPWIELKIDRPESGFEVVRCDAVKGKKSALGDSWRINRVGPANPLLPCPLPPSR